MNLCSYLNDSTSKIIIFIFFKIKNIYQILIILFIYRFITSFKLINLQLLTYRKHIFEVTISYFFKVENDI